MSTAAPPKPKINAQQIEALARAEAKVIRDKAALATSTKTREEVRARYRPLIIPELEIVLGGYKLKVTPSTSGPSFSIAKFLEKHKLTDAMKPFYKDGSPYDRWTLGPDDERKALGLGL